MALLNVWALSSEGHAQDGPDADAGGPLAAEPASEDEEDTDVHDARASVPAPRASAIPNPLLLMAAGHLPAARRMLLTPSFSFPVSVPVTGPRLDMLTPLYYNSYNK